MFVHGWFFEHKYIKKGEAGLISLRYAWNLSERDFIEDSIEFCNNENIFLQGPDNNTNVQTY